MGFYIDIKIRGRWIRIAGRILFSFFFLLSFSESAVATHEADHRYVISGYVRDEAGAAIENARVDLEHKGGEKKTVDTNSSGYYEILFHLHDDNLGDEIIIRVDEVEKRIKVSFDKGDTVTSRGDSVDFGAKAQETEIWQYLTYVSLLIMVIALYIGMRQLKKKKKALARQEKRSRKKKK